MGYDIGQIFPLNRGRGITGDEILGDPHWHCIVVPPQKEAKVAAIFQEHGLFAFYPSVERWRKQGGKKISRVCPIVAGMVFVKFTHWPNWDVLKAQRHITGVLCVGAKPVLMRPSDMSRLKKLSHEAKERAAEMAKDLKVSDRAEITAELFAGSACTVLGLFGGEAEVEVHGHKLPFRVRIDLSELQKVDTTERAA